MAGSIQAAFQNVYVGLLSQQAKPLTIMRTPSDVFLKQSISTSGKVQFGLKPDEIGKLLEPFKVDSTLTPQRHWDDLFPEKPKHNIDFILLEGDYQDWDRRGGVVVKLLHEHRIYNTLIRHYSKGSDLSKDSTAKEILKENIDLLICCKTGPLAPELEKIHISTLFPSVQAKQNGAITLSLEPLQQYVEYRATKDQAEFFDLPIIQISGKPPDATVPPRPPYSLWAYF